jgi:hypothetical protein
LNGNSGKPRDVGAGNQSRPHLIDGAEDGSTVPVARGLLGWVVRGLSPKTRIRFYSPAVAYAVIAGLISACGVVAGSLLRRALR